MTDVFETGTFTGPQALWDRLNQLVQDSGWTVRATPETGVERVYFSDGEDGYADHYMKMQHKLEDDIRTSRGYMQRAGEDGYTDYVNFLGYQWYPNAGGSNDGYGEIGRFGPRMYAQRGRDSFDIRWTNLVTAQSGDSRWTDMANYAVDADNVGGQAMGFDGHRYIYHVYDTTPTQMYRYDISNGADTYVVTAPARICNITCSYVREIDKTVVFYGAESTTSGLRSGVFEVDRNGTIANHKFTANFASGFQYGCSAAFGRYIYAWRGTNTSTVQVYDYLTDTWTAVTNMPTVGWSAGCAALIVTKEQTGLANHRIYTLRGQSQNDHYYMDLEDDGLPVGFPGGETWSAAPADAPFNTVSGIGYEWDGNDRIHYWPGVEGTTDREYYYYKFSTNTWHLVNVNFMWATGLIQAQWRIHDSYQSRVRAFLGEQQQYWFFGNKDRITVVTKSDAGQYFYCYAGGIDSYFDDTIKVPTTGTAAAGSNVVIPLADTSSFAVGQTVQISDLAGMDIQTVTGLDDRTRQYLSSEHVTIASILPNTNITVASLNNNYSAGAIVGVDLQNFVTSVEQTRYMQATNIPNTSNNSASGDPAEQVYVIEPGVDAALSAKADLNARTEQFIVWPLVCFTEGTNNRFSGREVRGQLYNTYMMGAGSGASEDIVEINGVSYLIFNPAGQQAEYLMAFGPVL